MCFSEFPERITPGNIQIFLSHKEGIFMQNSGMGMGIFLTGAMAGMVAGAALGATMAPSSRQIKRTVNKAAKKVNQAVDNLANAIAM